MRIPVSYYAPAMAALYKLWEASMRHEVIGWDAVEQAKAAGRSIVFAHFHDETFCLPYLRLMGGRHRFVAIVSQSQDGEIMAQLLQRLGLVTARGSKSRGGVKALILARKSMRQGCIGVVTVDGPRGPRHKVKEGAIYLTHKTDALLVPIRITLSRKKVFEKAWDKFQLPLPGAKCRIVLGAPYELDDKHDELDSTRLAKEQERLEQRMLALG